MDMPNEFKDSLKGKDRVFGEDLKSAKWIQRKQTLIEGCYKIRQFMTQERHISVMDAERWKKTKEKAAYAWKELNETISFRNSPDSEFLDKARAVAFFAVPVAFGITMGGLLYNSMTPSPRAEFVNYLERQKITAISNADVKKLYSDKNLVTFDIGKDRYSVLQGNVIEITQNKKKAIVPDDVYLLDAIEEAKAAKVNFKYSIGDVKTAKIAEGDKIVRLGWGLDMGINHKADNIAGSVAAGLIAGLLGFLAEMGAIAGLDKLRGY